MIKEDVDRNIDELFNSWDSSDIEKIKTCLGEEIADNVMLASYYPNYNDSDVKNSIKNIILACIEIACGIE